MSGSFGHIWGAWGKRRLGMLSGLLALIGLVSCSTTRVLSEDQEWLAKNTDVCLGSDAFFPFGDNIERAHKSGVRYVAQAGGSVRDDHVIETCDKYGIAMAFTGVRLFHH